MRRLTLRESARLQSFPDDYEFSGEKSAQYRQVGNAFPPPVAKAVGGSIRMALAVAAAERAASELAGPARLLRAV